MLSPVRPSVVCLSVCLSVALVRRAQTIEIFGNVSTPFGTFNWLSIDIHGKIYGDRPRGTPTAGGLNARAYSNIAIFDLSKAISRKQCKIGGKLVLITNRK